MTTSTDIDRNDLTPRQPSRHGPATVLTYGRPGSPLKQEVLASPDLDSPDDFEPLSPTPSRSGSRVLDQTQRWTVLAREAEADEVSILSITSEERDYYTSLLPDSPEEPHIHEVNPVEWSRTSSQLGSVISGFSEGAFVDNEHEYDDTRNIREESVDRFSEIDYGETTSIRPTSAPYPPTTQSPSPTHERSPSVSSQFSSSVEPPPFIQVPPSDPLPESKKYVYYPLPIPKQLMLPPRLTGPNASKNIPLAKPVHAPIRAHATDALDSFLDTHLTALQEDPHIVLQTEFDSNTLMGTLMNNLRDQKLEIKGRARTNEQYVPGGKSLLEMDAEIVQRMHMGKALSSHGGRNWGSASYAGGSSRTGGSRGAGTQGFQRYRDDEVFESVSLMGDMEYREDDEDVPLAVVREGIVTQRQDAEESLVERMKRLKQERQRKEVEEGETLVERMARLKLEQGETLQQRKARLQMKKTGQYI